MASKSFPNENLRKTGWKSGNGVLFAECGCSSFCCLHKYTPSFVVSLLALHLFFSFAYNCDANIFYFDLLGSMQAFEYASFHVLSKHSIDVRIISGSLAFNRENL